MRLKYVLVLPMLAMSCFHKDDIGIKNKSKGAFRAALGDEKYKELIRCLKESNVVEFESVLKKNPEIVSKGPILVKIMKKAKRALLQEEDMLEEDMLKFIKVVINMDYIDLDNPFPAMSIISQMKGRVTVGDKKIKGATPLIAAVLNCPQAIPILFIRTEVPKYIDEQDETGRTALMYAVEKAGENDPITERLVDFLIKHKANVNIQDNAKDSALTIAAKLGNIKMVDILLSAGADINNKDGNNPLYEAISSQKSVMSEYLVKKGASTNAVNGNGETLLISAIKNRQEELIKTLLEQSANIDFDIQDGEGKTALMHAIDRNMLNLVNLILSKNPDLNKRDKRGNTAIMYAAIKRSRKLITLLARNSDINAENLNGETALTIAVQGDDVKTVKTLLSLGSVIRLEAHKAAEKGNIKILAELLSVVGDTLLDSQDGNGMTPLMHAARHGHVGTEKLILEHNSKLELVDRNEKNALMYAAENGNAESVSLLLTKTRSLIEAKDVDGLTALMHATINGHLSIVRLLSKIVKVDEQDREGKTALMHAIINRHSEIINFLLARKVDVNLRGREKTALICAIDSKDLALVIQLLKAGADLNVKLASGKDAFLYAIKFGNLEIVKYFIETGNVKGENYKSLVQLASISENEEVVKLLVQHDKFGWSGEIPWKDTLSSWVDMGEFEAELSSLLERNLISPDQIISTMGRTLLMLLVLDGHENLLRIALQNCRCNPNLTDSIGNSAMHYAVQNPKYSVEIIELLVKSGAQLDAKVLELANLAKKEDVIRFITERMHR